jgi:hypothetical protein
MAAARARSGPVDPRKEVVDLNAAILEVTALTHSEAVKTGITVDTQLTGDLPPIRCDRVQLQQVLRSARSYTTREPTLITRVRVEQRDHMRTCETLRDANQRLEVTNEALRIENVERKGGEMRVYLQAFGKKTRR